MLPVLIVVVAVLLIAAAAFDWRARRRGEVHRTKPEYWHAVGEARREERYSRFVPGTKRRPRP